MKKTILALALASISCGSGAPATKATTNAAPAPGSKIPSSVVDPYLKIQAALADDRVDDVRANASEVAKAASSLGPPAAKIDTAATQLASTTQLEEARDKFGVLSDAVVAYVDAQHLTLPDGVRTAYCPMVHKPWLQKGDTIDNPYYGSSMLTCGEFR